MSKLRYLMPAAVLVAGSGSAMVIPATHALAAGGSCDDATCLWYSVGSGSAIWESNEACVYPNFSQDKSCNVATAKNDKFKDGTGAGKEVRNDAHSMANCSLSLPGYLFVSPKYTGSSYEIPANDCRAITLPDTKPHNLRNNEASYHD